MRRLLLPVLTFLKANSISQRICWLVHTHKTPEAPVQRCYAIVDRRQTAHLLKRLQTIVKPLSSICWMTEEHLCSFRNLFFHVHDVMWAKSMPHRKQNKQRQKGRLGDSAKG